MSVRPLPRGLAPLNGESLPGLILRLAYRLERSPARIASLCGLNHPQNRIPAEYLIALPPDRIPDFATATRLHENEVHALTLSSLWATYPPLQAARIDGNRNTTAASKMWAANLSSRYCPECLAGDGSPAQNAYGGPWKLGWHLPVTFACTVHRRLLAQSCPRCGGMPNRPSNTERQGLIMQRAVSGLHPAQCRHPAVPTTSTHPSPCGARLDEALPSATLTNTALSLLLALQSRIDQRLLLNHRPDDTARPASDRHFFPDLIVAAQLVRLSWPDSASFMPPLKALIDTVDRHVANSVQRTTTGRRPNTTWAAPQDPAECGALLLTASLLLGEERTGGQALIDRVQPLAATSLNRNTASIAAMLRRMDVSPDLARALVPRSIGFYRAGGHRHTRQRIPSRHSTFDLRHVPALLPQELLLAHFHGLLTEWKDHSEWDVRHLRRVASLKLAEMSGGGTWPQCAEVLHIPWNTAQQSLKVLKRNFTPNGLWPLFNQSVETVAVQLDDTSDRIDYRCRREVLQNWRIPDTHWAELCDDLDQFRQGGTSPSSHTATVLAWAAVTQGDHLHSPLLTALRSSGSSTQQVVASINALRSPANRKGAKLELLNRIEAYASRLAARCDHSVSTPPLGHETPTGSGPIGTGSD
ncbi:TniQ family protein [Streptomyces sp. NPDC015127]|uniref:TniQ family protein n=1 Tax=Streptomyces sp. NPDC015127 TaxID=3364939 RepID=UPI00370027AE